MTLLQAIFLGILQGITEFLPISSSGHLILGETLLHLDVSELKDFDVVVHLGTLLAILLYFWRDFLNTKFWPWIVLGSLPAVLVGFTLEDQIDALFRNATSVGIIMIVMGVLFLTPEKWMKKNKELGLGSAVLMGIAQAVAIIPGVSRSGSTIFTGTMLGLKREEAARFSFLLGGVAIAGAGLLTALDLETVAVSSKVLVAGFATSFLSGLLAITWLMQFLKTHSLRGFGVYRIFIGLLTIALTFI